MQRYVNITHNDEVGLQVSSIVVAKDPIAGVHGHQASQDPNAAYYSIGLRIWLLFSPIHRPRGGGGGAGGAGPPVLFPLPPPPPPLLEKHSSCICTKQLIHSPSHPPMSHYTSSSRHAHNTCNCTRNPIPLKLCPAANIAHGGTRTACRLALLNRPVIEAARTHDAA